VLGVSIYAFPDSLLESPTAPMTAAERSELGRERSALEAGRQASEQSWSGQLTTDAVELDASLPFMALPSSGGEAWPSLRLNLPTGTDLARKLGALAEKVWGIKGPKIAIRIPGVDRIRIPDALNETARRLIEIKNTARLSYTLQLRDFVSWCEENDYKLYLYVRRSVRFSKPLKEAIDRGEILLKYLPDKKIRLRYIPEK
jgi:hypothetical protein